MINMPRCPYVMASSSAPSNYKAFSSLAWSGVHECIEKPDCHYMRVAKHKIAEAYFNQVPPLYVKGKSFEPFSLKNSKLNRVQDVMELYARTNEKLDRGDIGEPDAIYFYRLRSLIRRDLTMMAFEDVMTSARLSFPKAMATTSERLKLETAVKSVNVEHVASHIDERLEALCNEPVSVIAQWLEERDESASQAEQAEGLIQTITHQK